MSTRNRFSGRFLNMHRKAAVWQGVPIKRTGLPLRTSFLHCGNIPEMNLYFEGDHPRSSMITVTNRTVKEVLAKYTLLDAVQETIEFDGGNGTYPSCGQMALFTITFFDKTSAFSKNVLIGTDADARTAGKKRKRKDGSCRSLQAGCR